MNNVFLFGVMCMMALSMQSQVLGNENTTCIRTIGNELVDTLSIAPTGYVDLGLPSGTLWKDKNENGFFTYDEAVSRFGSSLPSKERLEELNSECKWEWYGSGYKVTGPNGNSIMLPASGYRGCDGGVGLVGSYGGCWSSTPKDSDDTWCLAFISGGVYVGGGRRCNGLSVRLVQD